MKRFKRANPDRLYIHEAAEDERLMKRVHSILGDGVRKFLDYLIELKEKHTELFDAVISDYKETAETS